jgi:hypothetical protein
MPEKFQGDISFDIEERWREEYTHTVSPPPPESIKLWTWRSHVQLNNFDYNKVLLHSVQFIMDNSFNQHYDMWKVEDH